MAPLTPPIAPPMVVLRAMVDRRGTNIAECNAFCSQLLANLVRLEYLMVEFDLVSGQKTFSIRTQKLSHMWDFECTMRVLNSILLKASCVGCREEVHLLRHIDLEMRKFDMRRDIDGEHDSVQGQACVRKSF